MRTLVIAKILLKILINICEFLKIVLSLLHHNHLRQGIQKLIAKRSNFRARTPLTRSFSYCLRYR